jgi:phospholipid transport system substrate-binding protein
VTVRTFTRATLLSAMLSVAALVAAPAAYAERNAEAEAYVQTNATSALQALANTSPTARTQTFTTLMTRFADMPRIASFVLGRYSTQLRTDAALRADWNRVFQDYAIASYESNLTRYSANAIRVTNSVERVPGRDVIVRSEIAQPSGRPMPVQWRLMRTGESWKVVDVSLVLDGSEIWLAQQQQAEFLAALDRLNGNIRGLMTNLQTQTTTMRERAASRRS